MKQEDIISLLRMGLTCQLPEKAYDRLLIWLKRGRPILMTGEIFDPETGRFCPHTAALPCEAKRAFVADMRSVPHHEVYGLDTDRLLHYWVECYGVEINLNPHNRYGNFAHALALTTASGLLAFLEQEMAVTR